METIQFNELNIRPEIIKAVAHMGFEAMSPIQAKAIPVALEGKDIIGQAQTGTGKTAAFGIPVLQKVNPKLKKPQAIVLCPTRELAIQVADEIRKLAKYLPSVKILPIYGGQEISKQIRSLKAGVQVIIGTPGRIMDHMRRKTVKFDNIETVILDEADEMLDMGFREDIETILRDINEERQTMLFSATMPKPIMELARMYQKNPEIIRVVRKELTVPNITQYYYEVRPKNKGEVLSRLLDMYDPKLSVVFCNTKKGVDELVADLKGRGYFAEGLHGDMKQTMRDRVMNRFRSGKTDILVATDVAARGIDVDDVDAVFNYDLPQDEEYYVHRIGRTGRAGKSGMAFTFVVGKEVYKLRDIRRYCKAKIKAQPIPSLNDVTETRVEKIFDRLDQYIEGQDLDRYIDMVESFVNEKDYTAMDVAAAFLAEILKNVQGKEQASQDDFGDTGAEEGMVRLFINIGKKQGIRPGNILGAIAGESGIPGDLVGTIDMYDKYTFVEVPREVASDVLAAMKNVKIKGKSVNVEPANRK
ncbi:MAG: DEAD/DEAH box helicase [Eubacterium sp.]|nr:DEAD/DEAH box helicase [Eubacterium sp.]MDD7210707.1 DEAD/DEAH box helicase [Lachnospiraceae bacterium]MDY5496836.1 DEAD/DEAH box helicase [Anaerobutyricum sp.]